MRYVAPRHVVVDGNPAPTPFWRPGEWGGDTAIIIGGGPSHTLYPEASYREFRFIATNSASRHVASIARADDILYFSDNSWSERFADLIHGWRGLVVTSNRNTKARLGGVVNYLDLTGLTQWMQASPDHVQASSGHIAACLAAFMGARRIVLIGFECGSVGGRSHGHNDYTQHDPNAFSERFLPGWTGLAPAFKARGVEVLNATPETAIRDFPLVEFV